MCVSRGLGKSQRETLSLLEEETWGFSAAELGFLFGFSERRGRALMASLAERGLVALDQSRRPPKAFLPAARAERLRTAHPGVRVVVAQEREDHAATIRAQLAGTGVELEVGSLHGTLARARAALAASGTVLTDLLHHRLPAVVVYALSGRGLATLAPFLVTTPWFATTNLLAGEEIYPERSWRAGTPGPVGEVGDLVLRCYNDAAWRIRCRAGLERAARRLGPPGATERAARHVLAMVLRRITASSAPVPSLLP